MWWLKAMVPGNARAHCWIARLAERRVGLSKQSMAGLTNMPLTGWGAFVHDGTKRFHGRITVGLCWGTPWRSEPSSYNGTTKESCSPRMVLNQTLAYVTNYVTPACFAWVCIRDVELCAATCFANRAFHTAGGQEVGKTPPHPTPKRPVAPRTSAHENGTRDCGSPLGLHDRSDGEIIGTWTYWRRRSLLTCESQRDTWTCWFLCNTITVVVVMAKKMIITRQTTIALTVSRGSRRDNVLIIAVMDVQIAKPLPAWFTVPTAWDYGASPDLSSIFDFPPFKII